MNKLLFPLALLFRVGAACFVLIATSASAAMVKSIARQEPGPVVAGTSVVFRVTFDVAVTGVTTTAFHLATTGTATGTIASITDVGGGGKVYDVPVNNLSGIGMLRLDFSDGSGVTPAIGGVFTGGQSYLMVSPGIAAYGWGQNHYGEVGNNSAIESQVVPVAVTKSGVLANKTVVALAAGTYHSLAVASDGTLYAWGQNSSGQLGDHTTTRSGVPVAVDTSAVPGKIIAVAAGYGHSLALTSDGAVYAWGDNSKGQLGNASVIGASSTPVAVDASGVLDGKTVIAIAAGGSLTDGCSHSLALASDGTVYAWGDNSDGQLGDGSIAARSVPVAVNKTSSALMGKTVIAIAAGVRHSMALASDGTVCAWGDNTYGQLGDASTTDRLVPVAVNTTSVIAIAAGAYHSLALVSDGSVRAWGYNARGQLGDNSTTNSKVPVAVHTISGATALSAGLNHSLALADNGSIYAWGYNADGQLGNNSIATRMEPVVVSGLTFRALGFSGGSNHSLALATIPPPTITAVSPTRGPTTGGTSVTITGKDFTDATAVRFGSTAGTGVTVDSATQIRVTAPAAAAAGAVDVTVTTPSGSSASAAARFTYFVPLTITEVVAPANGTYGAGQDLGFTVNFNVPVTVTGTPRLALTLGGVTRYADYVSGSGGTALLFRYTVQAGDGAAAGVALTTPLDLNGGTVVDAAATNATLTFTPPLTSGVRVATAPLAPTVTSTLAGDGQALVRFSPPARDGGSTIASYTATSNPGGRTATGAGPALTVTGLTNGTSYTFTVTATNATGTGPASATSSAVTPTRSWAMNFGTADAYYGVKTAVDGSGNVYLAGYFYGPTLVLGTTTLTRIGSRDAFVAKLTPQGSVLWARNYGGAGANAYARGIVVDAAGQVYCGGYFSLANLTTPALTKTGTTDAFVMKLDPANGNPLWTHGYGGAGARALGYALGVDAGGSLYLAGCVSSAALTLAPGVTVSPIATSSDDGLVLKLAPADGSVLWARNYGGAAAKTNFEALGVDAAGSVYLGGFFQGGDLTTPAITKLGVADGLVVKLLADGTFGWASRYGGAGASASVEAVTVTADGVYVAGYARAADLTAPVVTRRGETDAVVMRLDPADGASYWTKTFGGAGAGAEAWALAADAAGNVYLGGYFEGANLTTPPLTGIGSLDALLLKLSRSGAVLTAKNYGGAGARVDLKGIAIDGGNNVYLVGGFSSANLTVPSLTRLATYDLLLIKDAAPGAVSSVDTPAPGAYAAGAALDFTVHFTSAVTVTGTPRLILTVGATTRYAELVAASSTATALRFRYTVQAGETDADGIAVEPSIDLNGGTIVDGEGAAAALALGSVSTATVRVDTTAPASPAALATDANPTTNRRPTITGTAEPGATVTLREGSTELGTATAASGSGSWSITPGSNLSLGTHALTATATDAAGNVSPVSPSFTVTIETAAPPPSKDAQTILFGPLGERFTTDAPFAVSATASSGLPVSFSLVSGPATLSGSTVTLTGAAGTVTIRASQEGNSSYEAAPTVTRSFGVSVFLPPAVTTSDPAPACGGSLVLTGTGGSTATGQWACNGVAIPGATGSSLTVSNMQPMQAGLYTFTSTTSGGTVATTEPVIVGVTTDQKAEGTAEEVAHDIVHPNGNTYDQLLLEGPAATLTADQGQVSRMSFCDFNGDIVQVEFSGAGTLSLVMPDASAPGPASSYNQPGVNYVHGTVGIVITGADETTNVSVFSVGSVTAVDQSLFLDGVPYDARADISFLAIQSTDGRFGGVRTGNVNYFADQGFTGVYAPGVEFMGPVNVGDIQAYDDAHPLLVLGSASDVRITGGSLEQHNGEPVTVSGIDRLELTDGQSAMGNRIAKQLLRGRLMEHGVDVTPLITDQE